LPVAYFSDFPDCTIIMPTRTAAGLENFKPLVEEALGHHMTKKVSRVICRTERNLRARQASLEVGRTEDRKGLAKATECKTLLYSRVVGQSFWSRPKDDYHNPVLSSPPAKKNPSALKRVASDSLFTHCVECLIR
jgi:hypothetical protein